MKNKGLNNIIKRKITGTKKFDSIKRIYLIGSEFLKTKFTKDSKFSYDIDFKEKKVSISCDSDLYKSGTGTISGKINSKGDIVPLLDISNESIRQVFNGIQKCTVEIYNDEIIITPYTESVCEDTSADNEVVKNTLVDISSILKKRTISTKYSIKYDKLNVLLKRIAGEDFGVEQISLFDDLGFSSTDEILSGKNKNKCPLKVVEDVTKLCTLLSDFKYFELFAGSGIGGKALDEVGCENVGYSEINPYATKNYDANFPNRKNYGDIKMINEKTLPDFDIVISGSPCNDLCILKKDEKGNVKGIMGNKSSLFFDFIRILNEKRPKWFIFENIRNLVNINDGNDWEIVRSEFEKNYNIKYEILNTSDFGVPQTRRRIYVVGQLKELGKFDYNFPTSTLLTTTVQDNILESQVDDKYYLTKSMFETVMKEGTKDWKAKPEINLKVARPLTATMAKMHRASQDSYYSTVYQPMGKTNVRRLTPREAARLQGLSDDYKLVISDTRAYELMGNAMSYNVVLAVVKKLALYIKNTFNISKYVQTSRLSNL